MKYEVRLENVHWYKEQDTNRCRPHRCKFQVDPFSGDPFAVSVQLSELFKVMHDLSEKEYLGVAALAVELFLANQIPPD